MQGVSGYRPGPCCFQANDFLLLKCLLANGLFFSPTCHKYTSSQTVTQRVVISFSAVWVTKQI